MNFKLCRETLDMTQQAFADMLGVPRRTLQNWEAGINRPPKYVEAMIEKRLSSMVIAAGARAGAKEGRAGMAHAGVDYERVGEKIILRYEGIEYRGDTGTAYEDTAENSLAVKCYGFIPTPGAGTPICIIRYTLRGQHDALGIYYDRPEKSILAGVPDSIEFFIQGEKLTF